MHIEGIFLIGIIGDSPALGYMGESKNIRHLIDKVSDDLDIKMNYTTTDEHVPEAEQNNRTIGERIRAAYHNLSYKRIPKVAILGVCTQRTSAVDVRSIVIHSLFIYNYYISKIHRIYSS